MALITIRFTLPKENRHKNVQLCTRKCGGRVYDFFKIYLSDRVQYEKINETISESGKICHYVPQGTVLSPVLFAIYINKLLTSESKGTILSLGDDNAIYFDVESLLDMEEEVQNDMKKIFKWFDQNSLKVNYEKITYLPLLLSKTTYLSVDP